MQLRYFFVYVFCSHQFVLIRWREAVFHCGLIVVFIVAVEDPLHPLLNPPPVLG